MNSKNWLITGASRGFGLAWAQAALQRGDKVVALARSAENLKQLEAEFGSSMLTVVADVTDRQAMVDAVQAGIERFGHLDVVVANAGYALFGPVEESSERQARAQVETNLFGTLWTLQAAMPHMRERGAGHLIVTSSLAGVITFPTAGVYNATKWAVEGLAETIASEVKEFGIKVTLVEPGGYDTDWRKGAAEHTEASEAYGALRDRMKALSAGRTLGDPQNTVDAILKVVEAKDPPLRIFLVAEWEAWDAVSIAA